MRLLRVDADRAIITVNELLNFGVSFFVTRLQSGFFALVSPAFNNARPTALRDNSS